MERKSKLPHSARGLRMFFVGCWVVVWVIVFEDMFCDCDLEGLYLVRGENIVMMGDVVCHRSRGIHLDRQSINNLR